MNLIRTAAESGLVDARVLSELGSWGLPVAIPDHPGNIERAARAIQETLESEDLVTVRQTDLDVLRQYLVSQRKGRLHLATGSASGSLEITFGRSAYSEDYLIAWKAETIAELVANGQSYLLDGRRKIYFSGARELYFGEVKAFMVCTPGAKGHGGIDT